MSRYEHPSTAANAPVRVIAAPIASQPLSGGPLQQYNSNRNSSSSSSSISISISSSSSSSGDSSGSGGDRGGSSRQPHHQLSPLHSFVVIDAESTLTQPLLRRKKKVTSSAPLVCRLDRRPAAERAPRSAPSRSARLASGLVGEPGSAQGGGSDSAPAGESWRDRSVARWAGGRLGSWRASRMKVSRRRDSIRAAARAASYLQHSQA